MSYDQSEYDPVSASDEVAMAAPSYEISLMARDHQMHHGLWQPPQRTPLHDFWSTLGAANSTYRPVLSSYRHAEQMRVELMARYNVPNTTTTDIPDLDLEGEEWVRLLHSAVYDFSQTLEAPGSQHYRNISRDDYYSEGVVHIMLWKVVHNIAEAQQGICSLPPWYTTDGPIYRPYPSFAERFREVELALRVSKACCCSLFSATEFAARLAWNPRKELKRKRTNQSINFTKNTVQAIGLQACKQQGISRNQDGELEDKASSKTILLCDGNKVAGTKEVPTALALSLNYGFKKQGPLSDRAKVTSKLIGPDIKSDVEEEHTVINKYQDSSSETQTATTTLPGYSDEMDALLARMSRPTTNTTSAFTSETDAGPQSFFNPPSFIEAKAYPNTQARPNPQLALASRTAQQPQVPQQAWVTQQAQASLQQQISRQMPVLHPYSQFESQNPVPLVNPQYGSHSGITSQVNNQQHQYIQRPDNTQNANTFWLGHSTRELRFSGDASLQQPRNGDQEEDDQYSRGQNINFRNPDVTRRQQ
ncbi:hypothetical protein F4824DRAFT_515243 [Ustulina deusta]|nr:hypothetical protein F4824DRAFT_515243 [Ustulina deusta]